MRVFVAGCGVVAGVVLAVPPAANATGYVPDDPCEQVANCQSAPIGVPQSPGLADTGSSVPLPLAGAGILAVGLGVAIVVARRPRRAG